MALAAINFGNDLGNFWIRESQQTIRRFFLSLSSENSGEGLQESFVAAGEARAHLAAATRAYNLDPSDREAWRELSRRQKELGFHFSFLDHLEEFPPERFQDPKEPKSYVYFGEFVLRNLWALPEVRGPIRRLKRLRGIDIFGRSYEYYDPSTGRIVDREGLLRDYRLVRELLRHLVRTSIGEPREALDAVIGVSAGSPALSKAIFSQLAREAGFRAVVLRPEAELIGLHNFASPISTALIVTIGTVIAELELVNRDVPHRPEFCASIGDAGVRLDREIERLIQESIIVQERGSGRPPTFEAISGERLFFWKDARLSPLWPAIRDSDEYFAEFQYPYRLGDKLTFRDIRPLLEASLIRQAARNSLAGPLEEALRQLLAASGAEAREGLSQVIVAGSGSRMEGAVDLIRDILAGLVPAPSTLSIARVRSPLIAVVEGAQLYGSALTDQAWQDIASVQSDWTSPSIEAGQLEDWYVRWSKLMDDGDVRTRLHYNLPWRDGPGLSR